MFCSENFQIRANDLLWSKFLVYKAHYTNSIIIPSLLKTHSRVQWSEQTIKKHLQAFIQKGWAKQIGNNIVLASKKDIHKTFSNKKARYIKIQFDGTYDDIRTQIQEHLVANKLRQMVYAINKAERKKEPKLFRTLEGVDLEISLSTLRKTLFYKSQSSVHERMKKMKNNLFSRFIPKVVHLTEEQYHLLHGVKLQKCSKGWFKQPCSLYTLLR